MRVETHPYEKDGISLKPTSCIGISNLKTDDSMASLFERADASLYMSKRSGRNKVSVSEKSVGITPAVDASNDA